MKDANNRQKSSSMILSISSPTVPDCDEIYCRLTGTWDGLSTTSGKTNAKRRLVQSNSSAIETKSTKSPTKQQPRIPNASTLQQHLPPIGKFEQYSCYNDYVCRYQKGKAVEVSQRDRSQCTCCTLAVNEIITCL